MVKLHIKLLTICSFFIIFISCQLENTQDKKNLYFRSLKNYTKQPELSFILNKKIIETILKYPGFQIVYSEDESDYQFEIEILKFGRVPLYYSKENKEEIYGGKYELEISILIMDKDKIVYKGIFVESISTSICSEYPEEKILNTLSERVVRRIYFEIFRIVI